MPAMPVNQTITDRVRGATLGSSLFLARVLLPNANRKANLILGDSHLTHQFVLQGFAHLSGADRDQRVLYRVEPDVIRTRRGPGTAILVQASAAPAIEAWQDDSIGVEVDPPRPFDPALTAGQHLRYRLRANVVTCTRAERKRKPVHDLARQLEWLARKGEEGGFRVEASLGSAAAPHLMPVVIDEGWQKGKLHLVRAQRHLRHFSVRFDGTLEVTDPGKLRAAVAAGIGPAKGFGFGLISLARG